VRVCAIDNNAPLFISAGILGFVLLMRTDKASVFLFLLIVLSASSLTFWQQYRLNIASFPISVPDLAVIAYGIYGIIKWLGAGKRHSIGVIGRFVIIWFLYQSVVGISIGLINGNPPYAIFQEYRIVLYATIAYFATLSVFRPQRHFSVVIWGILLAGVFASIWQMWISYSGRDISQANIAFITTEYLGRTLRDVNIPLYFAGPALMALVAAQFEAPALLGRWRLLLWSLAPILFVVPLLSMTRTVWVASVMSTLLVIVYVASYTLRHRRLPVLILFFVFFILALLFANQFLHTFLPAIYEGATFSLQYTFSFVDQGIIDRLNAPAQLFSYFSENGWRYITGLGFGNMWSGAIRPGPYLSYLVIGGFPGLVLFLLVWASPVPVYYRLLFKKSGRQMSPIVRVYILAVAVNWVMLTVIMMVMPPHWAEAAFYGINLAILTIMDNITSRWVSTTDKNTRFTRGVLPYEIKRG
jgi:hypothetical protein